LNKKLLISILVIFLVLGGLIIMAIKKGAIFSRGSSSGPLSAMVSQAKELEKNAKLQEAKEIYQKLIGEATNPRDIATLEKKVEEINIKLLFSPMITPNSTLYEIKPGDSMEKISKEFKTTVDLIAKSNNLSNDRIIPGNKIKVITVPFSIVVDKSQNMLILKSGEEVVKTYIVSTGANNSTPGGTFRIINKLKEPTWFKAGAVVAAGSPENILGSRWMGINVSGYGIHGTVDPKNLGNQVTKGCVRMANTDVEELYMIVPVGTEVTIVD
jgi:lipoprotein-anchoring transpeptidase ErfK/SrfK